jgi:eukaryotic-like serine/threonine-protein kinase
MSLAPGTRLGPYEILSAIGAGGMGEVCRARDTRLNREVAIKVLPSAFSTDAERLSRFEQEARAAAALNHPNILAVFDIGTADQSPYVVSELLQGETLRERLASGPLPVRKAIEYGIQIARGLSAAHDKGIVHRDLKPENIFVTDDGHVKILDFGLAKLTQPDAATLSASNLPTTPPNTQAGVVLGTIGYMSPEQVRGLAADHRADIFAFGVVLYEMLSGHKAFQQETWFETMTAIVKGEVAELPVSERHIPPGLARIVHRCLEKAASARFQTASDLTFALESLSSQSEVTTASDKNRREGISRERLAWTLVVALALTSAALVALGGIGYFRPRSEPAESEMRLQIATPSTLEVTSDLWSDTSFSLSPDGRKLVYGAQNQLWLRPLDAETAQPLPGTNGALGAIPPFWSPDGQSIGFFAGGQLKRIDIAAGVVRAIAPAPIPRGGTWNREGTILFAPSSTGPLYRVSASGGRATEVTRVEPPRQTGHRFPRFLPDGGHFLFFAVGVPETQGVYLGSLDSAEVRRLFDATSAATFAPPDYLLFARQEALLAQRFDVERLKAIGDPVSLAPRVAIRPGLIASAGVSASAGLIAYRPGAGERQLVWFERSGREVGVVGASDPAQPAQVRLSPDDRMIALDRTVGGNTDVFLYEAARGIARRFTSDSGTEFNPAWSPDGKQVAFTSDRNGGLDDLYIRPVDEASAETLLLQSPEFKNIHDWSSDGRFILYDSYSSSTGLDLWVLPFFGDKKPSPVARTAFKETRGRFSPDNHWIAFESDESGRSEVYVQPFPGTGAKSQMSADGGVSPEWRGDSREMFYVGTDGRLMAVPIRVNGSKLDPGTPVPLFPIMSSDYAVSADGQRFLVNRVVQEPPPITILLNWSGLTRSR